MSKTMLLHKQSWEMSTYYKKVQTKFYPQESREKSEKPLTELNMELTRRLLLEKNVDNSTYEMKLVCAENPTVVVQIFPTVA